MPSPKRISERTGRPARGPDDAADIAATRLAGWRGAYGPLLPPDAFDRVDLTRWTQNTRSRLETNPNSMRVAEVGGEVLGFCAYGAGRDEDLAHACEVYAIYAQPRSWSTGVGRTLMSSALDDLSRPVALWVLRDNPRARRFYEIAGFRPDGAEKTADVLGFDLPDVRYLLD
ncbi:MAG: GNAT family N-acetyltransferase [Streptosporangiaceae bacterium]